MQSRKQPKRFYRTATLFVAVSRTIATGRPPFAWRKLEIEASSESLLEGASMTKRLSLRAAAALPLPFAYRYIRTITFPRQR